MRDMKFLPVASPWLLVHRVLRSYCRLTPHTSHRPAGTPLRGWECTGVSLTNGVVTTQPRERRGEGRAKRDRTALSRLCRSAFGPRSRSRSLHSLYRLPRSVGAAGGTTVRRTEPKAVRNGWRRAAVRSDPQTAAHSVSSCATLSPPFPSVLFTIA